MLLAICGIFSSEVGWPSKKESKTVSKANVTSSLQSDSDSLRVRVRVRVERCKMIIGVTLKQACNIRF